MTQGFADRIPPGATLTLKHFASTEEAQQEQGNPALWFSVIRAFEKRCSCGSEYGARYFKGYGDTPEAAIAESLGSLERYQEVMGRKFVPTSL